MVENIQAALWITLYLWAPGWAWCWCMSSIEAERSPRWLYRMVLYGAASYILGVLCNALAVLVLGQCNIYTSTNINIVRVLIVLVGIVMACANAPRTAGSRLRSALPSALILLMATGTILTLPNRGEWLLGGWDPGIYANQATALSRTGSFYAPDNFFYQELDKEEQSAFTRTGNGRTERFPAVVVSPERQTFDFEFFRLTPALLSVVYDAGGVKALVRANTIVGVLSLFVLAALAWTWFGPVAAGVTILLTALQPIWLFHLHWPVTEHLQLFLIISFFFAGLKHPPGYRFQAICLAAAVLNRFAFLPFAGILLVGQAFADSLTPQRKQVFRSHLGAILLIIAAGLVNAWIAPTSLRGWSMFNLILNVAAMGFAGTLVIDACASVPTIRKKLSQLPSWSRIVFAGLLTLGVTVSWLMRGTIAGPDHVDNLKQLSLFMGSGALGLGVIGTFHLLIKRSSLNAKIIWAVILPLFTVSCLLILNKSISDLYPWATRRYLPWTVLWIALTGGYLIQECWASKWKTWLFRAVAVLLLAFVIFQWLPKSRRAFMYTSYNGAHAIFETISQTVNPEDVIISDHPLWGTPLALTYGLNVLNGREIWSNNDPRRTANALKAIRALDQKGYRVLILTSSSSGITLFPFDHSQWQLLVEFPEYTYQGIIQHPRAAEYVLETASAKFKIYQFMPQDAGSE